jgi:hypothetical protein
MKKTKGVLLVSLILLGIGSVLVFSQQYGNEKKGTKVDEGQFGRAEKVLAQNEAKLMGIPGVVAVGMGLTEKGDLPAIHVFVNLQATGGSIPASIPKQIDNVPVRIIETDDVKAR